MGTAPFEKDANRADVYGALLGPAEHAGGYASELGKVKNH
jgi:hypothetical protein